MFEVGQGYKDFKHLHGQNVHVIDVDNGSAMTLVEVRKYGDLYGHGLSHYLVVLN